MGILDRLRGQPGTTQEARPAPRPGGRHAPAPLPPNPVGLVPPPLPTVVRRASIPKDHRPNYRTTCPYCAVTLDPLPKAKKRCKGCGNHMLVRTGHDHTVYILREADLEPWSAWQSGLVQAQDAAEEAAEHEHLLAHGFLFGDAYAVEVVGESRRQRELAQIVGGKTRDGVDHACVALLVREPDNPVDEYAVAVYIDGMQVGYVARDDAEMINDLLVKLDRQHRLAWVRARIVGGWRNERGTGSFGVELDELPDEDEV